MFGPYFIEEACCLAFIILATNNLRIALRTHHTTVPSTFPYDFHYLFHETMTIGEVKSSGVSSSYYKILLTHRLLHAANDSWRVETAHYHECLLIIIFTHI
jgi:hypothetical protein